MASAPPARNESTIKYLGFNQDASRLSVGTTEGTLTYRCDATDDFTLVQSTSQGASIIEQLFTFPIHAAVGVGDSSSSQRMLRMYNPKREIQFVEPLRYQSAVLAVKLNRDRLVVVLQETIFIYDMRTLKEIHVIDGTPANFKGVCALASSLHPEGAHAAGENNFLAYRGDKGAVHIYDVWHQKAIAHIEPAAAHGDNSDIVCMAFSPAGDKLATADAIGITVLVHATSAGAPPQVISRCVRGSKPGLISCISFSRDGGMFCLASQSKTIHIFDLERDPAAAEDDPATGAAAAAVPTGAGGGAAAPVGMLGALGSWVGTGIAAVTTPIQDGVKSLGTRILPGTVTSILFDNRSSAKARLPNQVGLCEGTVVAFGGYQPDGAGGPTAVMAVTRQGMFHRFQLPPKDKRVQQWLLKEAVDCGAPQMRGVSRNVEATLDPAAGGAAAGGGGGEVTPAAGAPAAGELLEAAGEISLTESALPCPVGQPVPEGFVPPDGTPEQTSGTPGGREFVETATGETWIAPEAGWQPAEGWKLHA